MWKIIERYQNFMRRNKMEQQKQSIVARLKQIETEIKQLKKTYPELVKKPGYESAQNQSLRHRLGLEARGLLIAYAYIRNRPFTSPEKKPYNEHDILQYMAKNEAKRVLGYVGCINPLQIADKYSRTVILPNERFDSWVKGISQIDGKTNYIPLPV